MVTYTEHKGLPCPEEVVFRVFFNSVDRSLILFLTLFLLYMKNRFPTEGIIILIIAKQYFTVFIVLYIYIFMLKYSNAENRRAAQILCTVLCFSLTLVTFVC